MKNTSKILIGILLIIVLLAAAGVLFSYLSVTGSLPRYSGEIHNSGAKERAVVQRDDYGIPYISAKSSGDAAFVLGYVHAQERMFQMDLIRRIGEGRLSEVFGNETVIIDKLFRTIGIKESVYNNYDELNDKSKELLENYSRGVNEYLKENRNSCGIEFDVLNYSPEDWKPQQSLIAAKLMSAVLNINWWTDMAYADLLNKLDKDLVMDIIAGYPENAPTIIPDKNYRTEIDKGFIEADKIFRRYFNFEGTHIGSNNWVVNGARAEKGKPLIANDIHLALQLPGTWFIASINSPDWSASGFTLPGLPGIVIGTNGKISWAVTNVMTDDSDFYFEKIDSSGTKYFYEQKWHDLKIQKDSIKVRDSLSVNFEIKKTGHGPLVSGLHPYNFLYGRENNYEISMRWAALDFSDELFAIYSVNNSSNWNDFKNALSHYKTPGQNFMYSDSLGNIGYICAARIPKRKNNSPTMVFDGTINDYEWTGYVPYDEMPKIYNPEQNYLASANNKIDKNFKYHISNIWEPPSRIMRINELINSKQKHSVPDFMKYQMDDYSNYAKEIVPYILESFKDVKVNDNNLKMALTLLEKWNFRMEKESQTPAIFLVFYQNLLKNIFLDEMGEKSFKEFLFIANVPYKTVSKILKQGYSKWFDNINTENIEDRNTIVLQSLSDAIDELTGKLGKNIADWQWGRIHKIELKHIFTHRVPILSKFMNIGPFEISGDGTTINNTEYTFTDPYDVKVGASLRFIYDFSSPEYFECSLPAGESGHFTSRHFKDFNELWMNGKYHRVYLNSGLAGLGSGSELVFYRN